MVRIDLTYQVVFIVVSFSWIWTCSENRHVSIGFLNSLRFLFKLQSGEARTVVALNVYAC